jgi:hypothetical protein
VANEALSQLSYMPSCGSTQFDSLDSKQAITRDGCRAYLVWQHCFSPVLLTNLFSISWRRGGGGSNDTRLMITPNLLKTYESKNRTTRCMPASYVQNHVQKI